MTDNIRDNLVTVEHGDLEIVAYCYPGVAHKDVVALLRNNDACVRGNEIVAWTDQHERKGIALIVERKPAQRVLKAQARAVEKRVHRSTHLFRSLMAARIAMSVLFVGWLTADLHSVTYAAFVALALHHFRTFDTDLMPCTCSQKVFNFLLGVAGIGTLLICVGQPWLMHWLTVSIGILFGFLVPSALSYLVHMPAPDEADK